jgi:ADP-ribose pyrophosphatase YjhB (NUDIX family)
VHREFGEEIGQRLTGVQLPGVLENIFQWQGATQHKVVFMFRADFADPTAYEIEKQPIRDQPPDDGVIGNTAVTQSAIMHIMFECY